MLEKFPSPMRYKARGVVAPPAEVLFFVKKRFGVSIDWLLTGEGEKSQISVAACMVVDAAVGRKLGFATSW